MGHSLRTRFQSFAVILCTAIVLATPASATILVTFTGSVDQFNPGPLTANSALQGSFEIDDTIASTGPNMIRNFSDLVDSVQITVQDSVLGELQFSGENGSIMQFCQNNPPGTPPNDPVTPCDPGTRFVDIRVGGADGTVTGSANGFDLQSVDFDLRGDALFGNPFALANALTEDDFNFSRMTMNFDGTSFALERSLDTLRFTQVPEPNMGAVLGWGLIAAALAGRNRGR